MGELFNPTKAGGVLTILEHEPAATTDANAVYLMSAVVPPNSITPTSGIVVLQIDGTITSQAGGATIDSSTCGVLVRNSVVGVPVGSQPFPAALNGFFNCAYNGASSGFIDNVAEALALTATGWGFYFTFAQPNNNFGSCAFSNQTTRTGSNEITPYFEYDVDLDFTQETLWQFVLVQNGGGGSWIPPANYASWAPTLFCQAMLIT